MKIGTDAVEVLKNFAEINSNLWIPEGHRIRTMNVAKTCLAEAMLAEGFERDVGIYDLKQFLGVLSIHEEPEIDLDETFMTIRDLSAKSRTRYWYAAREIVFSPPGEGPCGGDAGGASVRADGRGPGEGTPVESHPAEPGGGPAERGGDGDRRDNQPGQRRRHQAQLLGERGDGAGGLRLRLSLQD